jgi:hypothetical protein
MAVRLLDRSVAGPEVARVVKYRAIEVMASNEPRHLPLELVDRLKAEPLSGILVAGFQTRRQHLFSAKTARAGDGLDVVEEQPIDWESVQNFRRVFFDELTVGRVHAQRLVKPGFKRGCSDHPVFRVSGHPFRVVRRRVMIPLDGKVDRCSDFSPVAGLDLLAEQFLFQVRVPAFRVGFGVEVEPPVVARANKVIELTLAFSNVWANSSGSKSNPMDSMDSLV